MNRMDIIILLFLVGATAVVATVAAVTHKPDHYFLLTNANETHFEISEYESSGWNAILLHIYVFERAPEAPPVWEVGG